MGVGKWPFTPLPFYKMLHVLDSWHSLGNSVM